LAAKHDPRLNATTTVAFREGSWRSREDFAELIETKTCSTVDRRSLHENIKLFGSIVPPRKFDQQAKTSELVDATRDKGNEFFLPK
jgi:hypothetical protein